MSSFFQKKDKKVETAVQSDFTTLDGREASFVGNRCRWPSSLPAKDIMAEAGFFFTPNDRNSDCTTCFKCGIKMFNWLPDDTPKVEHKKFSPLCKEVKTWTDVVAEPERNLNRAEQTESQQRIRNKFADKAKRLTGGFHRKSDVARESEPLPSISRERSLTMGAIRERNMTTIAPRERANTLGSPRELRDETNDEERLANVRRQREVAEKSLEGLEKLASYYQQGSAEQKRAEQSIVLQHADLEKLRDEEIQLTSQMGALSFGRGWDSAREEEHNTVEPLSPVLESETHTSGRASSRAAPMLPSQMMKDSKPRLPAHISKVNVTPLAVVDEVPSYEAYKSLQTTDSQSCANDYYTETVETTPAEEWTEYFTDAGVPYYYNTISKKTVWQIPSNEVPATPLSPSAVRSN